ncbi:uncharacterized protein LOC130627439 [Hydractinia symbiolongicarpus]|uniref:uncharacterized protein LOC130627439 n=1 Tax=Hydractinia symbiolongicarpus TaxID=13093 RepID=UPI00254AC17E|nr:uncharacterized protein LOC130627439 [Hydractinia symbiolongicarpus]
MLCTSLFQAEKILARGGEVEENEKAEDVPEAPVSDHELVEENNPSAKNNMVETSSTSNSLESMLMRENIRLKKKISELENQLSTDSTSLPIKKNRKKCPLQSCDSCVTNLSRHMIEVHYWPQSKAKYCVGIYGLRKPGVKKENCEKKITVNGEKKKTFKKYHKLRKCPILGCHSRNKRMSLHLQDVHKLSKGPYYYSMLKLARVCDVASNNGDTHVTSIPAKHVATDALPQETSEVTDSDSDMEDDEVVDSAEILERFVTYKISVDGGKSCQKSAIQSKQQLRDILAALDSSNPSDLVRKYKIRDTFLTTYAEKTKEYKALTIKRYLLSLSHFYDFLLTEEIHLPGITPDMILRMKVSVSRWSKSYNGTVEIQQLERQMEEQQVLITPEQIQRYEESASAKEAISIIKDFCSPYREKTLSRQEYACIRDFLITEITIINCQRSGVPSNMTIDEAKAAVFRDGKYIIKVKRHKTFRKHGPVNLCTSETLYQQLLIFIDSIRSQIHSDLENVFVSYNDKMLESGAISKQINSTWKRSGVYGENDPPVRKNITSNIFRKSGSTIIEDKNPSEASYVASLLTHSESTSKKYYRLIEKEKYALKGTAALEETFNKRGKTNIYEKKKTWTDAEVGELETLFKQFLTAKAVRIGDIRNLRETFIHLIHLSDRQILDKLRSYWRYGVTEEEKDGNDAVDNSCSSIATEYKQSVSKGVDKHHGKNEDVDEESEDNDYENTVSGKEKIFSNVEANIIVEKCAEIIRSGPISINRVERALESSSVGKRVLQNFDMSQIQTRLKYERLKYRKSFRKKCL